MKYSIAQLNEESGLYTEVVEYTLEEIREMAESRRLSKTDLVYAEGFSDWEELGSLNLSEFQKLPEFIPSGQKPPLITVPPPIPPSNIIRVIRKGETIGPYSRDLAKEYFAIGWLLSTDWGWHDGMDEWEPLNEVLGIVVSPPAEPPKPSSKLPPVIGDPGNHDAPDPNKTTPTDWRYETKEISTFKGILAMSSKKTQLHYIERLGDRLIVCTRDGKREDFIFGQFEATTYIDQEDLR
jgi:hypothetical protein